MFKVAHVVLLLKALVAVAQDGDGCCHDNEQSLREIKYEIDALKYLIKDLSAESMKDRTCPPDYTYLPSTKSCYMVVYENLDWNSAGKRCKELRRGSYLAAVTSADENSALKTFLAAELSKNVDNTTCIPMVDVGMGKLFWTSGQRLDTSNCNSRFVWKLSSDEQLSFEFTDWNLRQPDCNDNNEFCVHIWPKMNFHWNDLACIWKICPLCEYNP